MPQFQLEIAIALAVCAGCSLGLFLLRHSEHSGGKIELPVHANGEDGVIHDPFEVTKPEDRIDGYPIDGEGFWRRMRIRKVILIFLFATIVILQTISLGWSVAADERDGIAVYTLHVVFAIYLLLVAARSVNQVAISSHSESIIHLSALTSVALLVLFSTAITPSEPLAVPQAVDTHPSLKGIWYANLGLYFVTCIITVTTPRGPKLHFPPELIYSEKTLTSMSNMAPDNVCGITVASVWDSTLFSYTTKVVMLGNISESLEIADLPIVPANMRATVVYDGMKRGLQAFKLKVGKWRPKPGSGWELGYRLIRVNSLILTAEIMLAALCAVFFYAPPFFLQGLVRYLELDPERKNREWGWMWLCGLFFINCFTFLLSGQLWSLAVTTVQVRIRTQLNSVLFAKTLIRKDVASSKASAKEDDDDKKKPKSSGSSETGDKDNEDDFSSKAQIMTLMTTDVDRLSEFSWHLFTLVDAPIEIVIGTIFLYKLLGVSCFWGLAVTCLFLPLNHFAGKVIVGAQENLMKARDERVALMNEILGAIRMLKFMAWERSFEAKVMKIRERELKYQKMNYIIETLWNAIWNASPILVTLVTFFHFTVIRHQTLSPSIAFTSITIFNEMKFALNAIPETLLNMIQSFVSMRRIEKYLNGVEVTAVPPLSQQSSTIAFQSATVTWPQDRSQSSRTSSAVSTPRQKFVLVDLSLNFPKGELSLVCGKLGSGKTLLLLALLGEADLLTGQALCPRSPPDILAQFAEEKVISAEDWIVDGACAFVPQSAWLRNASIKDNILFTLPYDEERYQKTLEVCALISDLKILEDGDESEIGERGVNLSGGQKARVSLARAVYSRASILLLDDVLSAVDAHTAHHLFHECLQGDLMKGRTVILVSHHVQLCAPHANYVVALDNGRVIFSGDRIAFQTSGVIRTLVQSTVDDKEEEDANAEAAIDRVDEIKESDPAAVNGEPESETSSTVAPSASEVKLEKKKAPRKLIEEEKRAVGHIGRDIWETYIRACGPVWYWVLFVVIFLIAALGPVLENGWLKIWSGAKEGEVGTKGPLFYVGVYATITAIDLVITTSRWFFLYAGAIHASKVLYQRLLESVLFAKIRFHDTISRGRLLNRFGKDFEGIDSSLSDNFGRSFIYFLSTITTLITISVVGGLPYVVFAVLIGILYYNVAKVYGQTSRDMRRLDSVTRSPLYSIYGETIAGVTVLRAFGASSKFLRDMLRCVDTNTNPYYWMWGVNRWLSARFDLLSAVVVGATGLAAILSPKIDASLAGFALAFSSTLLNDLLFLVRRFVGLEQSMVALERVKEFSELEREFPEFVEPRPAPSWPSEGRIECQGLVIRYAPDLPNVLHNLNFVVNPAEKVGILGRTGSGKSTLALSFFRFVEPTEGSIVIDGIDITKIGLTDLRNRLTIIPQDPTILSGTLRSTLDVFDEYQDAEIFEALRRVHLIPSEDTPEEADDTVNANIFRNLESPVSEGGENFSTGEKQLLCMARAILKRSKVLVMDEATASVDYATDELISKTIRHEFAGSTILTIAHRLRTVIDYDRVMLLDQGRIAEFDKPATLLQNPSSMFYDLCKATGADEFAMLRKLAGAS